MTKAYRGRWTVWAMPLLLAACVSDGRNPDVAYPYRPATELKGEAQAISDRLDAYVRRWLAGQAPAELPPTLVPAGSPEGYTGWRLVRYEDIMPEDQWIVRPAAPVDYAALHGLFPDSNATYVLSWDVLASFGYKVVVEGEFPRAHFFDIQAVPSYAPGAYASGYNGLAELPVVVVDVPALPGHANPYRVGADRLAERRGYRQEFLLAMGEPDALNPEAYAFPFRDEDPARYATGIMNTGPLGRRPSWQQASFIIRAAVGEPRGEWSAAEMWLRTYAPDEGTGPLGGAPLPKMHYETPEGDRFFVAYDDAAAERQANGAQAISPDRDHPIPTGDTGPEAGWTKLYGILRSGLDILNANGWLTPEEARHLDTLYAGRVEGADDYCGLESLKTLVPYTNYLTRDMSIERGHVMVLTGRMPSFPDTRGGAPVMRGGRMRY